MSRTLSMLRSRVVGLLLPALMVVVTTSAHAATLHVPSEYPTISAAVSAAVNGDVIVIAEGTYELPEPVSIGTKLMTIRGAVDAKGAPATILSGRNANRHFTFNLGTNPTLRFENLRMTQGRAVLGGAVSSDRGGATFRNCVFDSNVALSNGPLNGIGGAVAISNSSGTGLGSQVVFEDCVFSGNSASNTTAAVNGAGGAVHLANNCGASFTRCVFVGNSVPLPDRGTGGAVMSLGSQTSSVRVSFVDCVVEGNTAWSVGGLALPGDIGELRGTRVVGNGTLDPISGDWINLGGNCIAVVNIDSDGDGVPDECDTEADSELFVPDEYPTLDDAIRAAAPYARIHLPAGVLSVTAPVVLGGKFLEVVGAVDADGAPATIIDGGGQTSLLRASDGWLRNLVFQNSFSDARALEVRRGVVRIENCVISGHLGGGLLATERANLRVGGCRFEGNASANSGGAMRVETSTLHIEGTEFLNNRAGAGTSTTYFAGGALYVIGGSQADTRQPVTVQQCVFDGNNVPVGGGGIGGFGGAAMFDTLWSPIEFIGNTVRNNWCVTQGAVVSYNNTLGSVTRVLDCVFENNANGALLGQGAFLLEVGRCTFRQNAMHALNGSEVGIRLYDSLFEGNQCGLDFNTPWATVNQWSPNVAGGFMRNCIFRNNTSLSSGVAIRFSSKAKTLIEGCRFENNTSTSTSAQAAGAVLATSQPSPDRPRLRDSVMCGNAGLQISSGVVSLGGNCMIASCSDADGNGLPDGCEPYEDGVHEVPGEFASIGAALAVAGPNDVVQLAPGVHALTAEIATIQRDLTLRGAVDEDGRPASVLEAKGPTRHLSFTGGGRILIENIEFRNGHRPNDNGGAVKLESTHPTFRNCNFIGNRARSGGAVYGDYARAQFEDCWFEANESLPVTNSSGTNSSAIHLSPLDIGSDNGVPPPAAVRCVFIGNIEPPLPFTSAHVLDGLTTVDRCVVRDHVQRAPQLRAVSFSNSVICGSSVNFNFVIGTDLGGNCLSPTGCVPCPDADLDAVVDAADNCPDDRNPMQEDCDGDGIGDACDTAGSCGDFAPPQRTPDLDGDGVVDARDLAVLLASWGAVLADDPRDLNGDSLVDAADLAILLQAIAAG